MRLLQVILLSIVFFVSCSKSGEPSPASKLPIQVGNKVSFAPENDFYKYDNKDSYAATGISEADFNEVLDNVQSIYTPIFKSFGANLVINRAWNDSTVNAYALK